MKVFLAASHSFWDKLPEKKAELEALGHEVMLPSTVEDPELEERTWKNDGHDAHAKLIRKLFQDSEERVGKWCDAFYLLNYEKHGVPGYVGGAALIELYIAHREYKKIFIENDIQKGPMYDEIMGFAPTFVHGDLSKIK
ncbi:hypothetical protein IJH01_02015 [Candidatus Saccharibacteria bacterium]|nr:hypothetical protein [Candidatus Saccharibacteria bacterium]